MSDCILPVMGDNLSTKLCSGKKLRKVIDATCTSTSTSFRDFTFSGITAAELKSLLIGSPILMMACESTDYYTTVFGAAAGVTDSATSAQFYASGLNITKSNAASTGYTGSFFSVTFDTLLVRHTYSNGSRGPYGIDGTAAKFYVFN